MDGSAPRNPRTRSSSGTAAKRRSTPAKARAEVASDLRTVETNGLTLTLPPAVPAEIFMDLIDAEASRGTGDAYLTELRMLRVIVGPDQFIEIRNKVGGEPSKVLDVLHAVLDEYGMSQGESEASSGS
jgi:hypothetical protein